MQHNLTKAQLESNEITKLYICYCQIRPSTSDACRTTLYARRRFSDTSMLREDLNCGGLGNGKMQNHMKERQTLLTKQQ